MSVIVPSVIDLLPPAAPSPLDDEDDEIPSLSSKKETSTFISLRGVNETCRVVVGIKLGVFLLSRTGACETYFEDVSWRYLLIRLLRSDLFYYLNEVDISMFNRPRHDRADAGKSYQYSITNSKSIFPLCRTSLFLRVLLNGKLVGWV